MTGAGDGPRPQRPCGTTRVALVLVVVALALEALLPFDFDPPGYRLNGAHRIPGGLVLSPPSRASTPEPPPWLVPVRDGAPFTVRLTARTSDDHHDYVARLLTVSRDYERADLMIGQYKADLIVRVRRDGTDSSGEPPSGRPQARIADVFATEMPRRIEVQRRGSGVQVSVDGRVGAALTLGPHGLGSWDPNYRLALGDEHRGSRPWTGTLTEARVEVGAQSFDYLGDAIEVPRRFWYLPERVRTWLSPAASHGWAASAGHGASFILLGILADWALHRRRLAAALVVLMSVALVAGKVLVAGRHPSASDLVAQMAGGLIGIALARRRPLASFRSGRRPA